jgi:hypothetical protein
MLGLTVGIMIGAMDFSLAKGVASMIKASNARSGQAIIMAGFMFRLAVIGILLWMLSRASNVSFLAVCIGLTGAFTVLTLRHALRSLTGREHKQVSDRR